MNEIIHINETSINVVSNGDTFIVSNKEVALAFGTGETSIRNMKNRNKDELLENVHWVTQYVSGAETTMWTKKGIITLGFKLKTTEKTIAFRDWASDYIINKSLIPKNPMEALELFFDVSKQQDERIVKLEQTKRLESWQEKSLQDAKNQKVYEIANDDKEFAAKLHRKVWSLFKKHFHLPRYNELPSIKHQEGLDFIRSLSIADMV